MCMTVQFVPLRYNEFPYSAIEVARTCFSGAVSGLELYVSVTRSSGQHPRRMEFLDTCPR